MYLADNQIPLRHIDFPGIDTIGKGMFQGKTIVKECPLYRTYMVFKCLYPGLVFCFPGKFQLIYISGIIATIPIGVGLEFFITTYPSFDHPAGMFNSKSPE